MASHLQLILGGARSGKSSYALSQGGEASFRPKIFLATATPDDPEMRRRILQHRKERGANWKTLEEPYHLSAALSRAARTDQGLLVLDCATLWISNLLCGVGGKSLTPSHIRVEFKTLFRALPRLKGNVRVVSNEVGLGIVPGNFLSRQFQDLQGEFNRNLATIADQVIFMTAGLPSRLK